MVSVIINYCSNEDIFIHVILKECLKFSDDIVVSYGSHLYDGTPENADHITELSKEFPNVQWVKYDVDVNMDLSSKLGVVSRPTAYWHNLARWTAVNALKRNGWVFVLDCDEIPEGERVKKWLSSAEAMLRSDECYKIYNHWYFKYPWHQATTLEDSVLLIHSKYLTEKNIFGDYERDYLINASGCVLQRGVTDFSGNIMFHHFSWVRRRDQLERKIKSWGHSNDIFKNVHVKQLVDYIYKDDEVNDVIHGYSYKKVDNIFGIRV